MPLRTKPTHTTLLGIVFLLLSILQATKINATTGQSIPQFYKLYYTSGPKKHAQVTYNKAQQKDRLQGPSYLTGEATPQHIRHYDPTIPPNHHITLYTATGTTLNPYVNPYNDINDLCNYNNVKDIKQLVIRYAIKDKPERPSTLIGKEVWINFKKITYQIHSLELRTLSLHPLDYKISEKAKRRKRIFMTGYVRNMEKKYNLSIPKEVCNSITAFWILRTRKHEKQDTQLLLLCKKQNTDTQAFQHQVGRLIASRKKSLPYDEFDSYMNYQDAIGFTAPMYLVQHMKDDIRLSTILALLFKKGAYTCPKDSNEKTVLDHAEALNLPEGILQMIKGYRAQEDQAALLAYKMHPIL